MNVIIDTNCLIASIPPKNPEYWLYLAFRRKAFDWVISNEIVLEYEEKIGEFYSPLTADLVLNILLTASNIIFSEPFIHWNLITADPDDNKFADLAISANAQYLVTNDHHFNVLKLYLSQQSKLFLSMNFKKFWSIESLLFKINQCNYT